MDGAVVSKESMLAAGSLLTPGKIIPSGQLWGGKPAKFMRKLTDADLESIYWHAEAYVEITKRYLEEQAN